MKKIFTVLQLCLVSICFSQTYNMPGANITYTTCSGTFYDSGGSGTDYAASETRTVTFSPATAGAKMKVVFTSFNTESGFDFLSIYDGSTTTSSLIGTYSGITLATSTIQASVTNTTGCLTFKFTSDGSVNYAGWAANLSCILPCQSITSVFNSSIPAPSADSIIRICQGQPITFNGSGNFSNNGVGATYSLDFGNGTVVNDSTAVVTYTTGGVYVVNLNITDTYGCKNVNGFLKIVHVSLAPSFSLITVADSVICLGDSTIISGFATAAAPFVKTSTYSVNAVTFLPDGSGISYTTCVNVSSFNSGQLVTSGSEINSICLNMEHSYQGDVSMQIVCPNGQTCNLKDYPGGAFNYLGAPLDDPAVGSGVGVNYCFAMNGTVLLINGPTIPGQGTPANTSIAAGTYSPTQNFNSLIGCPLNGNWCIKVTDNLAADNGYIFNWSLSFDQSNISANLSFTPAIASQSWTPNSSITSVNGDTIAVKPNATGTHCYTLAVTDDFNCNYFTTKCVTVVDTGICSTIATSLNNKNMQQGLIKIYPNPNNGVFIMELQKTLKIKIYNTFGQLYDEELLQGKHTIDLSKEAKGVYFIKINDDYNQQVLKLINQ